MAAAVWYDLRHALLLPFWRVHHRGLRAAVVTWRSPGSTVAELAGHDVRPLPALALWEEQLIDALAAAEGLPVLDVDADADAALADGAVLELGVSAGPAALPGIILDREQAASAARMAGWLASVASPHHR